MVSKAQTNAVMAKAICDAEECQDYMKVSAT